MNWIRKLFGARDHATGRSPKTAAPADLSERIRTILMEDWDPLVVNGPLRTLWDEYDAHIPAIMSALRDGADADQLQKILFDIEATDLGLPEPDLDGCRAAAEKLSKLSASDPTRPPDAQKTASPSR